MEGGGHNYTGTIFNDSASAPIATGSAPFTGSYSPETPLSAVNGDPVKGKWVLSVYDWLGGGNEGTVDGFSLDFVVRKPVPPN